jgi:hypothetical protein
MGMGLYSCGSEGIDLKQMENANRYHPKVTRMKIRNILVFLLLSAISIICRPKQDRVTKIHEDKIEVIINHLVPYHLKGEPSRLHLEKLFIIDFESTDIAKIGIWNITGFDVDSKGNIYVWSYRSSSEYSIFKFDPDGKYRSSIGRRGQGPGEIVAPVYLRISEQDEILISDAGRRKLVILQPNGDLSKEIQIIVGDDITTLLANGKILARKSIFRPEEGIAELPIIIRSDEAKEIATLHQGEKAPNWARVKKINGIAYNSSYRPWSIAQGHIYIGNKETGYEFLVYDFNGNLIKKIRKEYLPVAVPKDIKGAVLKMFERPDLKQMKINEKVFFPDSMPPYQYFFTDDNGRLFVMTYEKGEGPREFMYDIFEPRGIFIGRTSLDNSGNEQAEIWGGPFEAKAKNGRLYCMRAKGSGYQELVVYKMNWAK